MNKAVFLDRDGVINEVLSNRVTFVNKPEDFYLLNGVGEAIATLNDMQYKVFVVTNQGGIGLGYMSEFELLQVHKKMHDELAFYGALVNEVVYCPHKPSEGCACRKPKPTMIINLAKQYHISLANSYMVGDREPDIEAGKKAGTMTVLVGNKHYHADLLFPDLISFVNWLYERERK